MYRNIIYLVTGLPGSGKTTFIREAEKILRQQNYKSININSDLIAQKTIKKYERLDQIEDYTPEELDILYSTLYLLLESYKDKYDYIFIDGTFRYFSQRLMIEKIARVQDFKLEKIQIVNTHAKQNIQKRIENNELGGWVDEDQIEDFREEDFKILINPNKMNLLKQSLLKVFY